MRRTVQRIQHLLIALLTFLGSLISPLALKQLVYAQALPPDPRFGAVEAFWDPTAAVEAGVGWERILFLWTELQPHGPDDWNTLHVPEEWLQAAQAQGRQVVGLLKNTPYWATDADPALEASPPRGLYLPVDDPGNLWAAFVRRTAAFYGPRGVQHWIIWNEPDILPGTYGQEWDGSVEDYYQLLKVAYLAIKQADPEASVHLAGLTFWHDHDWLRKFLAVASNDPEAPANGYFFDVASLHIYFQTNSVDYIVNEMRAALAAYGLHKPVWINETNASPDSDPLWPVTRPRWRVDLREQASFILQAGALGLASGVERIAVYKMMDVGLPAGGEPFGLLRPDHSRRPAYVAFQLMTQHYAGARSAQLYRQPLVSQVTLDRGEYTTRVFWARTGAEVSLSVHALAAQALWIDQEGNAQTLDGSSGSYALTLPGARCADEVLGCIIGGPTYLLVESAPAAGLQAPWVDEPTPTLPPGTDTPTPTLTLAPTVTASATPSPTLPPVTPSSTMTMTPTPTLTLAPTVTASATPSPTATILPSATPHPPTPTPSNAPGASHGQLSLVGLVMALALLTVAVLWRLRRQKPQT